MEDQDYGHTKRRTQVLSELQKNVETRVLLEEYCQTEIHGILAKKRQVICGTDPEGSNGCGTKWFTLEIAEDQVLWPTGKRW
jgi:hypothetical protein